MGQRRSARSDPLESGRWVNSLSIRGSDHRLMARALRKALLFICERPGGLTMKRRDFLKTASALGLSAGLPAPAIFSSAKAQRRQETLLIVAESGPNNVDIHGVGTNVPGYEVSWNCYDRLISHEMKAGPNGVPYSA